MYPIRIPTLMMALLIASSFPVFAVEGPTRPDSTIFNHTIPFAQGATVTLPLYISRRGYYFAEVFFERAEQLAAGAVDVRFTMDVLRDGKLLLTKGFDQPVAPDKRAATLFRITSDRELPLKKKLVVVLRFDDTGPEARETIHALTFQIRRVPMSKGRF